MFAIGFLLLLLVGWGLLWLVSRMLPSGRPRRLFVIAVIGWLAVYPFFHLITASYQTFLSLCEEPGRYQVLTKKPVDFILVGWGYAGECDRGPEFIGGRGYRGFECAYMENGTKKFYRYTAKDTWREGCGLECFERTGILSPAVDYSSEHRQGFIDGRKAVVTYDRGQMGEKVGDGAKLAFSDRILAAPDEMAFARDYYYYPYGTGWATILGLASGTPPTKQCRRHLIRMDPRDVFVPISAARR